MSRDGYRVIADLVDQDLRARGKEKSKEAKDTPPWAMQGAWSGNNNLGVEIPFDLSSVHSQTILRLPEWGMPAGWNLSVRPRITTPNQAPLGAGDAFDAVLECDFGSGGIIQTFECDLIVGTRISLPANTVNLRARLAQADANPPDAIVHMSALLARGYARSHCTRSFLFSAAAEGGMSAWIEIPPFARSVQVAFTSVLAATEFYTSGLVSVRLSPNQSGDSVFYVGSTLSGPGEKMPIPAFQRYARIVNDSAAAVSAGFLIFNLFDE